MREYLDTGYWLEPGAVTVYCIAAAVESGVDMVALTQTPVAIDRRTTAARALRRRQLVTDLGDEATLGAQRRALVELACRGRLYLDYVDAHVMERT